MPPQIKQDLNRSGWESTDFPSVCESCLPENPYVKMLKEDYGAECKLCTRPFTVFGWSASRAQGKKRRTAICLTCARLKNCCQGCMLDLSFGLPIAVRDAALKMVAPGPTSDVNREYFAQNNEQLIEEGKAGVEEYDKTDEKARELLQRLARSKPYFRKGRQVDDEGNPLSGGGAGGSHSGGNAAAAAGAGRGGPGPIRTRDSRASAAGGARRGGGGGGGGGGRGGRGGGGGRGGRTFAAAAPPPGPKDWEPPADENIMSLFVTGVEDDLAEHKLREFFKAHGRIRSLVCSHMSHCAFVNYETRAAAEAAALACRGRAVVAGCPLRVRWGQPRAVGTMNREERGEMMRDGRSAFGGGGRRGQGQGQGQGRAQGRGAIEGVEGGQLAALDAPQDGLASAMAAAPAPPGQEDVQYASLTGN